MSKNEQHIIRVVRWRLDTSNSEEFSS